MTGGIIFLFNRIKTETFRCQGKVVGTLIQADAPKQRISSSFLEQMHVESHSATIWV